MSKKCTPLWREADFQVQMLKKNTMFGPLFEVDMSKKCTRLWREAHFKVKSFGLSDVVLRGRRKGLCTLSKVRKPWRFCSSFNYNHHYTTLHYTPLKSATLHCNYNYNCHCHCNCTTLHYTDYITLHYTTPHHTTLTTTASYNYATSTTLNYTRLHYTRLHYITLHYTHYTTTNATATTLH